MRPGTALHRGLASAGVEAELVDVGGGRVLDVADVGPAASSAIVWHSVLDGQIGAILDEAMALLA